MCTIVFHCSVDLSASYFSLLSNILFTNLWTILTKSADTGHRSILNFSFIESVANLGLDNSTMENKLDLRDLNFSHSIRKWNSVSGWWPAELWAGWPGGAPTHEGGKVGQYWHVLWSKGVTGRVYLPSSTRRLWLLVRRRLRKHHRFRLRTRST